MADFTQQTDDLFRSINQKYANVQVRGRSINEGVQRINQQIRAAFDLLGDFDGRIARIVERIRNLRGLSQAEKDRILNMLRDLDRQADEVGGEVKDLPEDILNLPEGIQQRIQGINDSLGQIEQALDDVERGSGAGGAGGGGGGSRVVRAPPPLEEGDMGGIDASGEFNPFVLSAQGKRGVERDAALARAEREQGDSGNPSGQAGGKKRRKTKRKGRKARKTRRGGYVIPKRRTHSAKGKKATPVAGKGKTKRKSKKSRK
jgi:archaellum component FlaC